MKIRENVQTPAIVTQLSPEHLRSIFELSGQLRMESTTRRFALANVKP
jgi:hypothetical protein